MSIPTASAHTSKPLTTADQGYIDHTDPHAVEELIRRASALAPQLSVTAPIDRSRWLDAVADTLLAHEEELAILADEETALGLPRLRGEITGAARSIRFYASVAVDGLYLGASSETVNDATTLSRWNTPVGPVAVFGASNFPFGFGVFGHDVASAIAAGCPVVAKAHPAHPRLSVRLAALASDALAMAGAPDGVYSLVVGFDAGLQIVDAAEMRAIAFTGSQVGGMALVERGARRGVPVYAEMGTVNPVFVTRGAVRRHAQVEAIAAGFVASFTLGAGQFCTKPGLLFVPAGCGMVAAVRAALARVEAAPLLTAGIAAHFHTGVGEMEAASSEAAAVTLARATSQLGTWVSARLISVALSDLKPGSRLLEECFGPVALICEYDEGDAAARTLGALKGSLVASVFTGDADDADDADDDQSAELVGGLLSQVGRVAVNAWPTGVANTWSQQHGGPWPATSRPDATSVGAGALDRFVRPVAVQNARPQMLPPALRAANPWNIPRRINGVLTLPAESPEHPKVNQ